MLIGAHESIAGGISLAFERAAAHRAKSLQIFTKSARGWAGNPLLDRDRAAFRAAARRTGIPSIAHGSYLVNLASEDPGLRRKSVDCAIEELTRCERLGVAYLVIHPGAHPELRRGIAQISVAIDEIHRACPRFRSKICLEVTAGQGNSIGCRFEHLEEILSRVHHVQRLGVCLDTCHLFAAGYDISTHKGYDRVLKEFDRRIGIRRVKCFHLNDCKKPLGCRVDRHEEIGKGTLGLTAFACLVNDPRFADTVGVLETPFQERYGEAIRLLEALVRR